MWIIWLLQSHSCSNNVRETSQTGSWVDLSVLFRYWIKTFVLQMRLGHMGHEGCAIHQRNANVWKSFRLLWFSSELSFLFSFEYFYHFRAKRARAQFVSALIAPRRGIKQLRKPSARITTTGICKNLVLKCHKVLGTWRNCEVSVKMAHGGNLTNLKLWILRGFVYLIIFSSLLKETILK